MKRRGFFRTLLGLPLAIPILAEAPKVAETFSISNADKFQRAITLFDSGYVSKVWVAKATLGTTVYDITDGEWTTV